MKYSLTAIALATLLYGCGGGGGGNATVTTPPSANLIEDPDGDGISTPDEENTFQSDPADPNDPVRFGDQDHDNDGIPNGADEHYSGAADDDADGLSNDWEYEQELNPAQAEVLVTEERFFSIATTDYSWIKLTLKTPAGDPIAGTAFHINTDTPALIRAIYPAKGWVTDSEGVIEAPVIALGTGSSNLYLVSPERDGDPIVISDIKSSLETYTHNPSDSTRAFSSIYNNSAPGSGYARSMLQSSSGWTPVTRTGDEWLELPVDANTQVTALLIQGRADAANWVSKLKISYEIAPGLREYANNGTEFNANSDRNSLVRIPFNAPAGISDIRIHPVSWFLAPSMRAALEVNTDNETAAINKDSDSDGFNDLLESRLGSDAQDSNSPRLHNPDATERGFSSIANLATLGTDGADGRLGELAWRPDEQETSPWTTISVPDGTQLVGVSLQGDSNNNQWTTALKYSDNTVAGLTKALLEGAPQQANSDANTLVNQWLLNSKSVKTLRIEPLTWQIAAGMRAGLWVIDTVGTSNSNDLLSDLDGDGLNTLQEQALHLDSQNIDSDGDGLSDGEEVANGGNPNLNDSDEDGLSDKIEQLMGSDPNDDSSPGLGSNDDIDNDGLTSAFELAVLNTDPSSADSDGDGLSDHQEINQTYTDPLSQDSDGDSLTDFEETTVSSNPNLFSSPMQNPTLDSDDDGVSDARENFTGTNANGRDTDGDGLIDGQEISLGSNPMDPDSPVINGARDIDNDGLSAAQEFLLGSDADDGHDPLSNGFQDLDNDGTPNATDADYTENGDEDGDGIANQLEYDTLSDPLDANSPQLGGAFDRDNDGTPNASDSDFSLTAADDSDGDGLSDEQEYSLGHNAVDANVPVISGTSDLDSDSVLNNLDVDYDPLADQDNDGWNNEFEYRASTDPTLANVAADFLDPPINLTTSAGAVLKKYTLPSAPNSAPFYSHNPYSLASVSISSSSFLTRDKHDGFNSEAITYLEANGEAVIINNTARRFRDLGLRNSSTGEVTRIAGTVRPFSRTVLASPVSNAELIDPNPLGKLLLDGLQQMNLIDTSLRVYDELLDDYQRLALGHKLMLNQPALWQSYLDYSDSACTTDICTEAGVASESLARLFFQEKPIEHALFPINSGYDRLSWQNKLALKPNDLSSYEHYHQARALSLGLSAQSGMLSGFSNAMDNTGLYSLPDATSAGTVWTEPGAYYKLSANAGTKTLKLKVYSSKDPSSLYLFSEAVATEFTSVTYDASTGEYVIVLQDAQWDTSRLAVSLETSTGEALPTMLLQWSSATASWPDQALACSNGDDQPCHD